MTFVIRLQQAAPSKPSLSEQTLSAATPLTESEALPSQLETLESPKLTIWLLQVVVVEPAVTWAVVVEQEALSLT
jgi:hypothetical protein